MVEMKKERCGEVRTNEQEKMSGIGTLFADFLWEKP